MPHRLPQTVCGFGDICVKCEPPLSPPLPPSHTNTKGPTPTFVSSDALSSGERLGGRGMCACGVCVCVWKSLGIFYNLMRKQIYRCQGAVKVGLDPPSGWNMEWFSVKREVLKCSFLLLLYKFFLCVFYSQTHCCVQPDHWLTSSCHFHRVANWPLLLATEMWLNFKVILINTVLRKQWLYNVSGCGARTGRNIIPPPTFFTPLHHPVRIACVQDDVSFQLLSINLTCDTFCSWPSMMDLTKLGWRQEVFSSHFGSGIYKVKTCQA